MAFQMASLKRVLGYLLLSKAASGRLTGITVPDYCSMAPPILQEDADFYVVKCEGNEHEVKVGLIGDSLKHNGQAIENGAVTADVHQPDTPQMLAIVSCDENAQNCRTYTIDVYRMSNKKSELTLLSVTGKHVTALQPYFTPDVKSYTAKVRLGDPFYIAASALNKNDHVGIRLVKQGEEFSDAFSSGQNASFDFVEKQSHAWNMSGFNAVGEHTYEICAAPLPGDRKHYGVYKLVIKVHPHFSTDLAAIDVGELALVPKFSPTGAVYDIKIKQHVGGIPVRFKARDPMTTLRVEGDVVRKSSDVGEINAAVKMHDNDELEDGEIPRWTSSLILVITSADGELSRKVVLNVEQIVSSYSFLKGLTVGRVPVDPEDTSKHPKMRDICKLTPDFDEKTFDYKCHFDWTVSKHAMIKFHLDQEKCEGCSLYVPDPLRERERQLSLQLMNIERSAWNVEDMWSRKFLYGEAHSLPIDVIGEDKYSKSTYTVHFERVSPWWMNTRFTRFISRSSSTLALVMSSFSVTSFAALKNQFNFMDMTIGMKGVPDTYADFASGLKVFSLDIGPMLPDMGLPTKADIDAWKYHIISSIQKLTGYAQGRLFLQYCIAYHNHDRLMANAMLQRHPEAAKELITEIARIDGTGSHNETGVATDSAGKQESSAKENDAAAVSRRLLELFRSSNQADLVMKEPASNQGFDPPKSFLGPRPRELEESGAPVHDKDDNNKKEEDDDDSGKDRTQAVWDWSDEEWQSLKKKMVADGVTVDTYPVLPCDHPALVDLERVLNGVHEWHMLRETLHSTTGTYIIMLIFFLIMGVGYAVCYVLFMKGKPMRFVSLEPGQLIIFLADYALIGFTTAAAKLLFNGHGPLTLHFYTPTRTQVQTVCVVSLVLYPIAFLCGIFAVILWMTEESKSEGSNTSDSSQQQVCTKNEQTRSWFPLSLFFGKVDKLQWNETFGGFADPACNELLVRMPSRIPSFVPFLPQLSTRHVRACIPVLDSEGAQLRSKVAQPLVPKKKLAEEKETKEKDKENESQTPWQPDDVKLNDMLQQWTSQEKRPEEEHLTPEEQFAMVQYIEQKIKDEACLSKYNILSVTCQGDCLKLKEVARVLGQEPKLGSDDVFIQNASGQRLVYPGDDWFGVNCIPGGKRGATPYWKSEPEEGWETWYEHLKTTGGRYADAWQWLAKDFWMAPWHSDDASDMEWSFLFITISKKEGLLADIHKYITRQFQGRVASEVLHDEKNEMRKWLWTSLLEVAELKLKLAYFASEKDPKFFGEGRGLESVATRMFGEERCASCLELQDHTLKKLKYTYARHGEPWWNGYDRTAEGEYKVKFNHDLFWKTKGDATLDEMRKDNDLVLENGYFSSPAFVQEKDVEIGKKRYKLLLPDGSHTEVAMSVKMGHVLPLMRYTSGFKLNVDSKALDMPVRSTFALILGGRAQNEKFNYVVDRGTTLLTICILSLESAGVACALLFFAVKATSFLIQLYSTLSALQEADLDGNGVASEEEIVVQNGETTGEQSSVQLAVSRVPSVSSRGGEDDPLLQAQESNRQSKERRGKMTYLRQAFDQVDVTVLCLQSITLLALCTSELQLAPAPLCGLFCILTCSATMIYMNVKTFSSSTSTVVQDTLARLYSMWLTLSYWLQVVMEWLNLFSRPSIDATVTASKVIFVCPALGMTFTGEPSGTPSSPFEEENSKQMSKRMAYYTLQNKDPSDTRLKSAREHPRYEQDVVPSLVLALDVEQMMMRRKIPQCVATIQCLNHRDSSISSTQHDSFLTLFKPDSWEESHDADPAKVQKMLGDWKDQVAKWLENTIGAEESEKTATLKIKEHIARLLSNECTGFLHRDFLKVNVKHVEVPSLGMFSVQQLDGRIGFVSILYDTEILQCDIPTDRVSGCGKFEKVPGEQTEEMTKGSAVILKLDSNIDLEVPSGVEKIRFCVWAQGANDADKAEGVNTNCGREELVCFTSEYDIGSIAKHNELQVPVHTQWLRGYNRKITPLGGEILEGAEMKVTETNEEEESNKKIMPLGDEIVEAEDAEMKKSSETNGEEESQWSRFTKWMWADLQRCKARCTNEKSQEEIEKTRGRLVVEVRDPNDSEREDDVKLMAVLNDVMGGDSEMTSAKLCRHKDRWFDLARFLGLSVDDGVLAEIQDHLAKMEALKPDLRDVIDEKQRSDLVLEKGIRRALANKKELDEAIESLKDYIHKFTEKTSEEERCRGAPLLRRKIRHERVGSDVVNQCTQHSDVNPFAAELLEKLLPYRDRKVAAEKEILHYVISSDHLKASKTWKPDAISSHVAAIVTSQYSKNADTTPSRRNVVEDGSMRDAENFETPKPSSLLTRCCNGLADYINYYFHFDELWKAIYSVFSQDGTRGVEPALKECLVSLSSNTLTFSFKDDQIQDDKIKQPARHEDAGENKLVHFDVPLELISCVKINCKTTYGVEQNKALRFIVNPRDAKDTQWSSLQRALNSEWEATQNEEIIVAMRQGYHDLWRKVTTQAGMLNQLESIRYYKGSVKQHPSMTSSFMRDGHGTQRWANGQVYSGTFENHLYHGEGSLYMSVEDMNKSDGRPLYKGTWENGKRHGRGIMRWEQFNDRNNNKNSSNFQRMFGANHNQRGTIKIYEGSFRDDLFHGHGTLSLERAIPSKLPKTQNCEDAQGDVPPPSVLPTHLVRFVGTFESSWTDTDAQLRRDDPKYAELYDTPVSDLDANLRMCTQEKAEYERYFQKDAEQVQKAGWQLPDIAMFAYKEDCGELMHLQHGVARYADGSEYSGQFQNKVPHGEGSIVQYKLGPDGKPTSQWLAKYDGQWERGNRHGTGTHTVKGKHIYIGDFVNNVRHGCGKTYALLESGERGQVMSNGSFVDDCLASTSDKPVWVRFGAHSEKAEHPKAEHHTSESQLPCLLTGTKRNRDIESVQFYHGQVNEEGEREGPGKLYKVRSDDEENYRNLIDAVENGTSFVVPNCGVSDTNWKKAAICVYEGDWKNNVPEGHGTQRYEIGFYDGHFLKGKRHGRGTWETTDGWKYSPVVDDQTYNWQDDLMHGIAVVEDDKTVHENVVYDMDECKMPFVSKGPPATGFHDNPVVGPLVAFVVRSISTRSTAKEMAPEKSDGVWQTQDKADIPINRCHSERNAPHVDAIGETVMYQEPTDLDMPDDDVLISGGTGDNDILNGLYFKVSGTFGFSIYKHVAMKRYGMLGGQRAHQRFLWMDETKGSDGEKGWWFISESVRGSVTPGPGVAFVDDDSSHPGKIDKSWYVWHPQSKAMRFHPTEGDTPEDPTCKDLPDNLKSTSIVGFEIINVSDALGPSPGSMFRAACSEIYGRPVYESQNGRQHMYWLQDDGSIEDGMSDPVKSAEDALSSSPEEYFRKSGSWIIASKLGAPKDAPECLAYCDDLGVTPDAVKAGAWFVRVKPQDPSETSPFFEQRQSFRLRLDGHKALSH